MKQASTVGPGGSKSRKLAMQMIVGAVSGAVTTVLAITAVKGAGFDLDNPARVLALLVGIVTAIMGVFVGLGTVAPGAGSRLLNVEDADELREQRKPLSRSSVVMLLVGAIMLSLALAGADDWAGVLSPAIAAVIVGASLLGISWLSYMGRNDNDELMRSVGQQGAAWGMYASLLVFIVWGSLAHLGYVPWITPLGLVSALMLIQLAAIFAVCGARGLLKPR